MESSPADDRPSSEERIDSLINEYFNRRKTGEKLTPRQFAAAVARLAQNRTGRPHATDQPIIPPRDKVARGPGAAEE